MTTFIILHFSYGVSGGVSFFYVGYTVHMVAHSVQNPPQLITSTRENSNAMLAVKSASRISIKF